MSQTPPSRSIVVVITARGGGDWPPVLALARGLADRGHRVVVICDAHTQSAVEAANLKAIPLPADLEQGEYLARHTRQIGTVDGTPRMVYPLMQWAEACVPIVESVFAAEAAEVVVSSLFGLPLAVLISSELGIPSCFVNPAYYFDADTAWEVDFAEPSRSAFREHFPPLMRQASLVLHATDPVLDFERTGLPANHHYVGPLMWEVPQSAPAWLDVPGDPWVLISLSTVPQPGDLDMARMAIDALEHEPVRILLTLAARHEREQLGGLPRNVVATDYVPHSQVLPLSRLVVSHAGHGIVIKSVYYGVPLVLVPLGRDQPGVARRAAAAGVAEVITSERRTSDQIVAAIQHVLRAPRYRDAALRIARHLQADDPVRRACMLVEDLVAGAANG